MFYMLIGRFVIPINKTSLSTYEKYDRVTSLQFLVFETKAHKLQNISYIYELSRTLLTDLRICCFYPAETFFCVSPSLALRVSRTRSLYLSTYTLLVSLSIYVCVRACVCLSVSVYSCVCVSLALFLSQSLLFFSSRSHGRLIFQFHNNTELKSDNFPTRRFVIFTGYAVRRAQVFCSGLYKSMALPRHPTRDLCSRKHNFQNLNHICSLCNATFNGTVDLFYQN